MADTRGVLARNGCLRGRPDGDRRRCRARRRRLPSAGSEEGGPPRGRGRPEQEPDGVRSGPTRGAGGRRVPRAVGHGTVIGGQRYGRPADQGQGDPRRVNRAANAQAAQEPEGHAHHRL